MSATSTFNIALPLCNTPRTLQLPNTRPRTGCIQEDYKCRVSVTWELMSISGILANTSLQVDGIYWVQIFEIPASIFHLPALESPLLDLGTCFISI